MTEFEKLIESQQYAADMLGEAIKDSNDFRYQQKLRLHQARLFGIKVFLELSNRKLEKTL